MPTPGLNLPDPVPDLPEHVTPTAPDDFEARNGVVYCRRCGCLLSSDLHGASKSSKKPCRVVKVELR